MRLQHFLNGGLALAAIILCVSASPLESTTDPDVVAVGFFPEDNPFGHVVNGEKNKITLKIQNQSDRNITITSISGSFHHPDTNAVIKQTTVQSYNVGLIEGAKTTLPYTFYSEFKPGDLKLNIWLNHTVNGETYRILAYDSIVTIVEPEGSLLDIQLIITYLIVSGLFGGLLYFAYISFAPQQTKKPKKRNISNDPADATATGAGGYQEEWIPDHHFSKKGKKRVLTSGDELSGAETSGTEGRKRKAKK